MALVRSGSLNKSELLATALILAFVLFLLLGTAFVLSKEHQSTTEITNLEAISAAEVVATDFKWVAETSHQILRRVDDLVGPDVEAPSLEALASLKDSISSLQGDPRVYMVRVDGKTQLTTDPDFKPIDIRDREYFQAVAQGAEFFISPMLVSRLNGDQIFVLSKRVERNGAFAGAAIISFNSELVENLWNTLQFDSTSAIAVVRDDGQTVARFPLLKGPLDIKNTALFTTYLPKSSNGIYETVSVADNVRRIVAYRKIEGFPIIASASIGRDVAFSRFNNFLFLSMVLVIPTAMFLAFLAWTSIQWMRRDAILRDQLAEAAESNQMLFREIHHRVKNNLQAVSSLINLQKFEPQAKQEMNHRISAMVAVHEQIYRNNQFGQVDASAYVPAIVDKLVEAYGQKVKLNFDLESIAVDREHALPIGLIANEVVSNSLKYAFPQGRAGELKVTLRKDDEGRAGVLTIHDNGIGFDPQQCVEGMGSKLLRGLVSQLHGESKYSFESGTIFELRFPLVASSEKKTLLT